MSIVDFLANGIGSAEIALLINRVCVGAFFLISGWHKIALPARHASLVATLKADGIPLVGFNQWFVPAIELGAGLALVIGMYPVAMALLLGAICLVATCTDGLKRIKEWQPVDAADYIDDLLYLPEVLLGIMLVVVITAGPGALTLHT